MRVRMYVCSCMCVTKVRVMLRVKDEVDDDDIEGRCLAAEV